MSNWADSPSHKRATLEKYCLNQLFNSECVKYCVPTPSANHQWSQGEQHCLSNCQTKTTRAFDLYMKIFEIHEVNKDDLRSHIDISKYAGFEIEHGIDTGNKLPHDHLNHVTKNHITDFTDKVDSSLGGLKSDSI